MVHMEHMEEHNPTTQHCCLSILKMLTTWQLIDAQINSLALLFFSYCFWTLLHVVFVILSSVQEILVDLAWHVQEVLLNRKQIT